MSQPVEPDTRQIAEERMPLGRYLRWIALACTDPQLVQRLTSLAQHFEDRLEARTAAHR